MSAGQENKKRISYNVKREASVIKDKAHNQFELPDDWRPVASFEVMQRRARLLAQIRQFMADRDILEVDTPILDTAANPDPAIDSLTSTVSFPDAVSGRTLYLHTSPEFAMKRLLAAGSGPIYQICKVFRDNECGRLHQPEFTMLEWYRPGYDHHKLMQEISELLVSLHCQAPDKTPYADAFQQYTGLDPHRAGLEQLQTRATGLGLDCGDPDRALLLDFIFSHEVAPHLGTARPRFIFDYPACQAALARISAGPPALAQRFELFINGIEIANGYNELCDVYEQNSRFKRDHDRRRHGGQTEVPLDQRLLAALDHGLPACAGVALGLDRLLLVLTGNRSLAEVLSYPHAAGV
jgi:lysyl-tRNA synthetase class 2